MSSPLVSIISVNYNAPEETIEFLDSLYNSDYSNFETIIVDNGSKNKVNKQDLESKYQNLTCIMHDQNLGFAGGNNLGVAIAKGKYFIFLNNDTLVPEDFISKMVNFFEKTPKAGMVSPKIRFATGKIQYAGSTGINKITGRGKKIGNQEDDHGQYDRITKTNLAHGAAMMVPQKVIDEVGVMYEDYFLYYEEHDWCMAVKKAGYDVYCMGLTHIIHKESVSVGLGSPLKVYYMNRNRITFQIRNYNALDATLSTLFFLFFSVPKSSLKYLLKGKKSHFLNLWRGILWHINKKYVYKNF